MRKRAGIFSRRNMHDYIKKKNNKPQPNYSFSPFLSKWNTPLFSFNYRVSI